jgi:oxalate decarboxylase
MSEFSRRDLLSTAVVAGAAMTASAAEAADQVPEPSRAPGVGGTDPAPGDVAREAQNPDLINPPATDSGTLPNLRFSFADAHVRQSSGGWTRQVTARELGISKAIAGVNMRLNAGGIRELHWHKQAEWAYMLYGTARITAIDPPSSKTSRNSHPSGPRPWIEWGMPPAKYQRSPTPTSSTKLRPCGSIAVMRAVP